MKIQKYLLLTAALMFAFTGCSTIETKHAPVLAGAHVSGAQKAEILALFTQWNKSLATGSPSAVAANYAPDAILLPTVSNTVCRTQAERMEYFKHFLLKKPQGVIDQSYVRVYDDVAINAGIYTFTFGNGSKVQARYTFVYQKQADGKWLIIEHHSSAMPE